MMPTTPADAGPTTAHDARAETASRAVVAAIFVPVALALGVAAIAGLPLFQDGCSYLVQLLLTHSAVRHHRLSVVLLQIPTLAMMKAMQVLDADDAVALPLVRLAFDASYAAVPLVALGLSWLVVHRRRPDTIVWPALIILFVNLVNFSWVSELLIGIQFSCPILLAILFSPGTASFRPIMLVSLPLVWLLHPLVAPLFAMLAVAAAYVSLHPGAFRPDAPRDAVRRATRWTAAVCAVAAIARALVSVVSLTAYESALVGGSEARTYLFATSAENAVLLVTALAIGCACWRGRALGGDPWRLALVYRACAVASVVGGVLLTYQYFFGTGPSPEVFPLKTGLTLFVAIGIMMIATVDVAASSSAIETRERLRLTTALAAVFAAVIVTKAVIWHHAATTLVDTLAATDASCIERGDDALRWVHRPPDSILDNWALPSLAIVIQDRRPRKLLVESGDCAEYRDSGMVQLDPWTLIPASDIVPPLG